MVDDPITLREWVDITACVNALDQAISRFRTKVRESASKDAPESKSSLEKIKYEAQLNDAAAKIRKIISELQGAMPESVKNRPELEESDEPWMDDEEEDEDEDEGYDGNEGDPNIELTEEELAMSPEAQEIAIGFKKMLKGRNDPRITYGHIPDEFR